MLSVILTGFNQYKTIVKSLTSVDIEITELMKRHQHIMKLQSEHIKEKMFIDCKLDEAIAKQCHLKKKKCQLLLKVVIPTISSHVKIRTVDKIPNPTLYMTPVTPPNTPSKPIMQHILSKRLLTDTEKGNMPKIQKDVVIYNFHDEIDDSQLLTSELNSTETLLWRNSMQHNICDIHPCNHTWQLCSVVLFWEWKY